MKLLTPEEQLTLGEKAYKEYRFWLNGRDENRDPIPTWEELHEDIRLAWAAGATMVFADIQRSLFKALDEVVK